MMVAVAFWLKSSNTHFRNCFLFLTEYSLDQLEKDKARSRRDGEIQGVHVTGLIYSEIQSSNNCCLSKIPVVN